VQRTEQTIAEHEVPPPAAAPRSEGLRRWALQSLPECGLLVAFLALVVALVATEANFRTSSNILEIFDQASITLIVAVPFAMLLIARHVDLSVGSAIAAIGVIGARLLNGGTNTLVACAAMLGIALLIGLVNGTLCSYLRFSPIVVTLGMLAGLRGLAFLLEDNNYDVGFSHAFHFIGQGRFRLGDVPIKVVIAAAVVGVGAVFLYRTVGGTHVKATGANPTAAFLVGVKVKRVGLGLYVATALAVGLAAIIQISELDSGPANVSDGFELTVLTAVLLGGVAFTGGRGSLLGVVLGVLFIDTLANGFVHWGFTTDQVRMTNGGVLVLAAGMQAFAAWVGGRTPAHPLLGLRRRP
jgi:ribose/xylose/arabinose/galactoside ABC-type transport system permease subunit